MAINTTWLVNIPLHVVEFCAEECKRQQSGEMSVYNMVLSWADMRATSHNIDGFAPGMCDLDEWARLIEPQKNAHGLRNTPVHFADGSFAIDADLVPQALQSLLWAWGAGTLTAEEIYQELEEIHPYIEGNGRLGALLFNLKRGTLINMETPPEFRKRR